MVAMIVTKPFPLVYFVFMVVETVLLPILKVPQIFKIFFFPLFFFFAFSINKCGRYSNIDDFKRLVPEIAHVFIGVISRLLSFGHLIFVLKSVFNDKTHKYISVLKTTISTEFVEYC